MVAVVVNPMTVKIWVDRAYVGQWIFLLLSLWRSAAANAPSGCPRGVPWSRCTFGRDMRMNRWIRKELVDAHRKRRSKPPLEPVGGPLQPTFDARNRGLCTASQLS